MLTVLAIVAGSLFAYSVIGVWAHRLSESRRTEKGSINPWDLMLRFLWRHMYASMAILTVPVIISKAADRRWVGLAFQVALALFLIVCEFVEGHKRKRKLGGR